MPNDQPPLLPSQEQAFAVLSRVVAEREVGVLYGDSGSGKSLLLQRVCSASDGLMLCCGEFVAALKGRHPLALEEAFHQLVGDTLAQGKPVFIDELDHLLGIFNSCGSYPRSGLFNLIAEDLLRQQAQVRQPLIFCGGYHLFRDQAYACGIADYTAADYRQLVRHYLGEAAHGFDFDRIFRFAPGLNGHQLRGASQWLRGKPGLDTEQFIDYLKTQFLRSNVALAEVQEIRFEDLKGVDDVLRALEANIILPLENDDLAKKLDLKPKRGVLLSGPPGTGETSIGRALAHRLKSKFFLVDGTMISGTERFYGQLHYLFEQAKNNAPSILFIDDSDVIFESGEELGLYRYLLTMLDGLESASAGRVCVMMTAMDISHLPPALIRSGRIELWLDMKLPDATARRDILKSLCAKAGLLQEPGQAEAVADLTADFTGADLKRLVEDAKILLAVDLAAGRPARPLLDCFTETITAVRESQERYAAAETRARSHRPQRPAYFSSGGKGDVDDMEIPF